MKPKYKRVIRKISGEALAGEQGFGIREEMVQAVARQVKEVHDMGVELAIVVGGGNFFRGVKASENGLERVTVDAMGMLATVINALAVADFLRGAGADAVALSAVAAEPFIERFERLEAEKKDIAEQQKEVMAEAKARGYDTKVMRKVIALRKRDKDDIAEEEAVLEMYKAALGMI